MAYRFFYGYVIIALCFANMVVMRGVNGAFGVYFLALLEEFPWSRSAGASIASANFFVYAIASPLVGLAFDRYGPRVLMPLGAFLTGLGLVLWTLWIAARHGRRVVRIVQRHEHHARAQGLVHPSGHDHRPAPRRHAHRVAAQQLEAQAMPLGTIDLAYIGASFVGATTVRIQARPSSGGT